MLKVGRSNLALTIFVPWDCKNKCTFCTVKKDYKTFKLSLSEVISTLEQVFDIDSFKDVVITGGEPLGDIDKLIELLDCIDSLQKKAHRKKNLYINTTIPKLSEEDEKKFIEALLRYHIDGFNVSRHIGVDFTTCDNDLMYDMKKAGCRLRVNSVISKWDGTEDEKKAVKDFIAFWRFHCDDISFRWDYRKAKDMNTLKSLDNPFVQFLNTFLEYEGSSGCLVCNDDYFENARIHFHRGCSSTLIKFGDIDILNDVVISPDGSLHLDWEGHEIEPGKLKEAIR